MVAYGKVVESIRIILDPAFSRSDRELVSERLREIESPPLRFSP